MKIILLLTTLFFGFAASAQPGKLTKVAGTKCSMVPPTNFVTATAFSGFQDAATGTSIMISELPAPYQTLIDGFTAEALQSKGMTLVSKSMVALNNDSATYFTISQPSRGTTYIKQILMFGDSTGTVIVNGIYPEESKQIEKKIKKALLSTVYDASQNDDPLGAASFSIDTENTPFKLVKYMSGSLLYSTDGKIPTDKPTIVVANSLSKVLLTDKKRYAEERIKKLPGGEFIFIKEIKDITINNLDGYEIVAESKTAQETTALVYQVMLFTEAGEYYIMIGQCTEDFSQNLEAFKAIAKTFKKK